MNAKQTENKELMTMEQIGNDVLEKEIEAMKDLKNGLDFQSLQEVYKLLMNCKGVVLITGSGTSSTIARRLAHTFTCSGIPSYFLDSGQCQHGYSAIITGKDILIGFSRGGETDEVNFLARIAKKKGAKVIGILENTKSTFANLSDIYLEGAVKAENEPLNTIPLSNTIVQAAVGDILCAAINRNKGFIPKDFGEFHPGGAVGKRLTSSDQLSSKFIS